MNGRKIRVHLSFLTGLIGDVETVKRDDRAELASTLLSHVEAIEEALDAEPPPPPPPRQYSQDERVARVAQAIRDEAPVLELSISEAQARLLAFAVLRILEQSP